jgi:hypothetical protein
MSALLRHLPRHGPPYEIERCCSSSTTSVRAFMKQPMFALNIST